MTEKKDDLEAVRKVVEALEGFKSEEIDRIIRWAREKLGFASGTPGVSTPPSHSTQQQPPVGRSESKPKTDIKTFVDTKNPKSDMHFAVTIAYYYRFEAPEDQRNEEITGDDLQEACRQVGRKRLKDPGQTLRNTHFHGLLDKGDKPGAFSINAVGENLVAMTLPVRGTSETVSRNRLRKINKTKASSKKKDSQTRGLAKISKQPAKKSSQ